MRKKAGVMKQYKVYLVSVLILICFSSLSIAQERVPNMEEALQDSFGTGL